MKANLSSSTFLPKHCLYAAIRRQKKSWDEKGPKWTTDAVACRVCRGDNKDGSGGQLKFCQCIIVIDDNTVLIKGYGNGAPPAPQPSSDTLHVDSQDVDISSDDAMAHRGGGAGSRIEVEDEGLPPGNVVVHKSRSTLRSVPPSVNNRTTPVYEDGQMTYQDEPYLSNRPDTGPSFTRVGSGLQARLSSTYQRGSAEPFPGEAHRSASMGSVRGPDHDFDLAVDPMTAKMSTTRRF